MNEEKLNLKIVPKYNLIYEIFMPTGKKVKKDIMVLLMLGLVLLFEKFAVNYIDTNINVDVIEDILYKIMIGLAVIVSLKLVIDIVFQFIQYKNISYEFYDTYMEYKDKFLNQQTKILKYSNITEVEVIRNIWERINGLGIIVIYTNAEKNKRNGLVIYAVKNTNKVYKQIQELINVKVENILEEKIEEQNTDIISDSTTPEEDFKNKLKNM